MSPPTGITGALGGRQHRTSPHRGDVTVTTLVGVSVESRPTLVIVGPPGSGKTTVGRVLARRLGVAFADVDVMIEERTGKSIADLFLEDGEDEFRNLER